ncbi:MAG: DNA mismatch repair protein MutS [Geminicoccaceae bacterium]|nr:DNA mismatch repair protein MutS [Geminicoccaceae bacterium]
MIAQFQALKADHPDALLFFRMGDFYELFFADAEAAAPALDIALTRRGRHAGKDIAMCGVPVHAADSYMQKLIRRGFKVAVCEQMEDPADAKKRSGKTLVRRDVVRIVTPGTLTEDALLEAGRANHLAALAAGASGVAVAWVDISTGAFSSEATSRGDLPSVLAAVAPGELLVADSMTRAQEFTPALAAWRAQVTRLDDEALDSLRGERRLKEHFKVTSLDVFGAFERAEIAAAGALLDYLALTQKGLLPRLDPPRRVEHGACLHIDPASRRNLELVTGPSGTRKGSLLEAIDRTITAAGARLLAERIAAPLARAAAIHARLAEVEGFVTDTDRRTEIRRALRHLPDLARALSRLALDRGGPRDLLAIGRALKTAEALRTHLQDGVPALTALAARLQPPPELARGITATLDDQPPVLARDGGFVRAGVHDELDRLRELRDQGRRLITELEARLKQETDIASLKIRHNSMLGYFIEVTAAHSRRVPGHFVQRQSMAGATRYKTSELDELEAHIASAAEESLDLELRIFATLRQAVLDEADAVAATARACAEIDCASALAELAAEQNYVAPVIGEDVALTIEGGRHPVVEQALAKSHTPFVANDCRLEEDERLWLLTGPNMAGKSTFLRQNALIVLLAQIGSFVPAARARIGLVDRLFSRVGAADDIARGQSTFMVEMVETAAILNQATERSLVILDEIGRGTATYDGLSIAWAVVEHLHEVVRCRGLFATHYHELTALAAKLDHLAPHHARVKEWKGEVVFLHEIAHGSADRSYGIHVARLAGLPPVVVERAQAVLETLEAGEARAAPARLAEDLPLFRAVLERRTPERKRSPLEAMLDELDPDRLTPREALERLYALKRACDETG